MRHLKKAIKDLTESQDSDDEESLMSLDSDDEDRTAKRQRGVQDSDTDSDE